MRKVKLYIAISLDGKIAGPNDEVDWLDKLPNPDKLDYGYHEFYTSMDTTIMGRKTYDMIETFGGEFPYPNTVNYVVTRDEQLKDNENVKFINDDMMPFVLSLKEREGKDIWLVGGGQLNTSFWNAGLIDEVMVFVMPIVLGEGVDLFGQWPKTQELKLIDSEVYSTGVCKLVYEVK